MKLFHLIIKDGTRFTSTHHDGNRLGKKKEMSTTPSLMLMTLNAIYFTTLVNTTF